MHAQYALSLTAPPWAADAAITVAVVGVVIARALATEGSRTQVPVLVCALRFLDASSNPEPQK